MSDPTPQATYNTNVATLAGIQKSAEEKYDSILTTLGSGFLALSVSFVKDIVAPHEARCLWLLYSSWLGFTATIVSTVLSLGFGPKAVAWHVARLTPTEFPVQGLEKNNPWNRAIARLNVFSGASFIIAVALTVAFVVINTDHRRTVMEKQTPPQQGDVLNKGFTLPPMQTGVHPPTNSPVPGEGQAPAPTPAPQGTGGSK